MKAMYIEKWKILRKRCLECGWLFWRTGADWGSYESIGASFVSRDSIISAFMLFTMSKKEFWFCIGMGLKLWSDGGVGFVCWYAEDRKCCCWLFEEMCSFDLLCIVPLTWRWGQFMSKHWLLMIEEWHIVGWNLEHFFLRVQPLDFLVPCLRSLLHGLGWWNLHPFPVIPNLHLFFK